VNAIYTNRRKKVFELLDLLQCAYDTSQAGMFVWAKIPATYKTGFELSDEVLYNTGVFITPGGIFGNAGNEYIRVSLCSPEEKFAESINRLKEFSPAVKDK
jgi:LL-diaminopimelate aminotransferase